MPRTKQISDDELLWRATKLFWRQGFGPTTTRELEAAIGLSTPAIYRRYGSKDELFVACVGYYVSNIVRPRIDRMQKVERALEGLRAYVRSAFEDAPELQQRGCLLTTTVSELPVMPDHVRDVVLDGIEMMRDALRTAVERAVENGEIDVADPVIAADLLGATLQGLLVLFRAGQPADQLLEIAESAMDRCWGPASVPRNPTPGAGVIPSGRGRR